ncbi:cell division regulator GpsB [Bacillus sp. FJAT-45037]|uniref:cell division regulator GpsB n=1 Tax=Bacillus sp. FJAT-45037 TaxID=2011007 RepID=UPI000C23179B|nr:cell division regulator GpsB [Bacillus sp. FJAT-45037]
MNSQEVRLSAKDILDKEFKTSMRGYNPDEVDKFLDSVIQDYEAFQKKVTQLEQENQKLRREMKQQSERPQRQTPTPSAGSTNYDILQRLSNLEKKVFGSKLYD